MRTSSVTAAAPPWRARRAVPGPGPHGQGQARLRHRPSPFRHPGPLRQLLRGQGGAGLKTTETPVSPAPVPPGRGPSQTSGDPGPAQRRTTGRGCRLPGSRHPLVRFHCRLPRSTRQVLQLGMPALPVHKLTAGTASRSTTARRLDAAVSPVNSTVPGCRSVQCRAGQAVNRSGAAIPDTVEALVLDLLEWVGPFERPYAEVLEAWRTSCPRLPVWEEATDRGFIERRYGPGRGASISVSSAGQEYLRKHRQSWPH